MGPKFKILEKVYHILPESQLGVVIDIRYNLHHKYFEYMVSFDPLVASLWYYEHELCKNKNYNYN